jgi:hypothetical protein
VVEEIQLDFRWWDRRAMDQYLICHREVFVVAIMLDTQLLFGKDYLMEREIFSVNESAMQRTTSALPLTPNPKLTKGMYQI